MNFTFKPRQRGGYEVIGTQENRILASHSNDGRGTSKLDDKQEHYRYSHQPRYMRQEDRGTKVETFRPDDAIVDIRNQDIDVSDDAIHWFHFGGDICVRDLPVYNPHK